MWNAKHGSENEGKTMFHIRRVLFCFALACIVPACQLRASSGETPEPVYKRLWLMDPGLKLPALSLAIPRDWRVEGNVMVRYSLPVADRAIWLRLVNPAGGWTLEFIHPLGNFIWPDQDDDGNADLTFNHELLARNLRPRDAAAMLNEFVLPLIRKINPDAPEPVILADTNRRAAMTVGMGETLSRFKLGVTGPEKDGEDRVERWSCEWLGIVNAREGVSTPPDLIEEIILRHVSVNPEWECRVEETTVSRSSCRDCTWPMVRMDEFYGQAWKSGKWLEENTVAQPAARRFRYAAPTPTAKPLSPKHAAGYVNAVAEVLFLDDFSPDSIGNYEPAGEEWRLAD
jgi:hypothetical protein